MDEEEAETLVAYFKGGMRYSKDFGVNVGAWVDVFKKHPLKQLMRYAREYIREGNEFAPSVSEFFSYCKRKQKKSKEPERYYVRTSQEDAKKARAELRKLGLVVVGTRMENGKVAYRGVPKQSVHNYLEENNFIIED